MIVVGMDGYRHGWVAVRLDGEHQDIFFPKKLSESLAMPFDVCAIDMPIGLPDSGPRSCDVDAKAMLRPHASRVFTGARRGLWDFPSMTTANRTLKARGEAGVSIQLWNLGPKITEVDRCMTPALQEHVREAHPELVFLRLNAGGSLPSKKTAAGLALRVSLLRREGFADIEEWVGRTRLGKGAKADDIVDACACAIAARDFDQGNVLPAAKAPVDAKGLKMQIWY